MNANWYCSRMKGLHRSQHQKNRVLNGAISQLANLCSETFRKQPRQSRSIGANPFRFRRGQAKTGGMRPRRSWRVERPKHWARRPPRFNLWTTYFVDMPWKPWTRSRLSVSGTVQAKFRGFPSDSRTGGGNFVSRSAVLASPVISGHPANFGTRLVTYL